jgi:hypothetical protein
MMENFVYEAPIVEIIEVEVEKGFAVSGGGNGSGGTSPVEEWWG